MKQTLKIGVTLVVVAALAMSGIALAAQVDDDTSTASAVGTPGYTRILDQLAPLVEDGTINDTQAAAVAEHLAGSFRGPGRGVRALHGLVAVADFLGLDADEMRDALAEYETIAAIAEANGSSADAVIDHLLALVDEHLDVGVENGRITEDEKAALLEKAEERITELVNNPLPEPGDRPFHRRGPGGRGFGPGPGA